MKQIKVYFYIVIFVFAFITIGFSNEKKSYWLDKFLDEDLNGNPVKAEEYIKNYIKEQPDDPHGYMFLAALLHRKGKINEVLQLTITAKNKVNSKDITKYPGIYSSIGSCYIELKEYSKAINIYQEYLAIDNSNLENLKGLAKAYELTNQNSLAIEIYNSFLESEDESIQEIGKEGLQRLKPNVPDK